MVQPYRLPLLLILFAGFILAFQSDVRGQALDDYRTKTPLMASWKSAASWERYDGSDWVNAGTYPTDAAGQITILNGSLVTISAALSVDQVVIDPGGTVINNGTLTVLNGSAPDLLAYGTFDNRGTLTLIGPMQVFGIFINSGTSSGDNPWIRTGGTYKHNYTTTAGVIPYCSWESGSILEIIGYTTFTDLLSFNGDMYSHVVWNCPNQTGAIPFPTDITEILGSLTIVSTGTGSLVMNKEPDERGFTIPGSLIQTGGILNLAAGSGKTDIHVHGNVTLSGGTLTETGGASRSNIVLVQDAPGGPTTYLTVNDDYLFENSVGLYVYGEGHVTLTQDLDLDDAAMNNSGILHCGAYCIRGASFALDAYGTLGIGHPYGIYESAMDGNIQTTARSFNIDANYNYECATGNSYSGDGLPVSVYALGSKNTGGSLYLEENVTVFQGLDLTRPIQLGDYDLIVHPSVVLTGTSQVAADGTGSFQRVVGSNGSYFFPVGTETSYSPFTLTVSASSYLAAHINAHVYSVKHPSNSSTGNYLTRYWSISGGGLSGLSYSAAFTYADGDIVGTESGIYCGCYSGSAWILGDQASTATNTLTISGQTSFSDFTGGESGALPVQLADLSARRSDDVTLITWRTLSEVNNYGFYVQRRAEATASFTDITSGFIPGQGTTIEEHTYAFTDREASPGTSYYRLRQVDLDGSVHAMGEVRVDVATAIPEETGPLAFALRQNYPNPFNPSTTVTYVLPERGAVRLEICDMLGRVVAVPVDEMQGPGAISVRFDASRLASGVYLYRLYAGPNVAARRMILVR